MSQDDDLTQLAVDAMLRLAVAQGWRSLTLGDIAGAADVPLQDLRARFACKASVLLAYARRVEAEAQAQPAPFDDSDTTRDRLFELLMQRLDVLAADRAAVAAIVRDLPREPLAVLAMAPDSMRLLAGVLEAAGVSASGLAGLLRCNGLAAIWLRTLTVWADDDSPDSARTMAALDGMLRQAAPAAKALAACPFSAGRPAARDAAEDRTVPTG
jgi:AcrR family transcriptional regulator